MCKKESGVFIDGNINILNIAIQKKCVINLGVRTSSPWYLFVSSDWANQASLFMGFSRQEYWSGLLFPSPGDLPDTGIKPTSPALAGDSLPLVPPGKP